ncbi:hypothetical protein BBJ29_003801 [Phytophthora kernoviae]|uniref:Uncharacterized protein n=1 Tax=Phytophthora kernoviae TaxID=325452 RepID=A0A3F2RGA3_9STRA|nr:hypothetical protein BBP00_00008122 [Phytophthora kernoviae]RLN66879.1 hypothetical protein BBJ29_003801 [Phytophthora kernoviae]
MKNGIWSEEEHDLFLLAIKEYPRGPWSCIANVVGSRSVRQVQTHTQKYYEKIMRRVRGLRKGRKAWARVEHRIDDDILQFCEFMKSMGSLKVITSPIIKVSSPRLKVDTPPRLEIITSPSALATASVVSTPSSTPKINLGAETSPELVDFDAADLPLAFYDVADSLPPFDEALDFLITAMEE